MAKPAEETITPDSGHRSRRTLAVVGLSTLVGRSGGFLSIFGSIYLTSTTLGPNSIVLVLTVAGVFSMLSSVLSGRLADRFSPRSILISVSVINAVVLAVLAANPGIPVALGCMILASGMTAAFIPPAATLVQRTSRSEKTLTTRFATFRLFLNIGTTSSPLIAMILGETYFDRLFLYSAIANLIAALVLLLTPRHIPQNTDPHPLATGSTHTHGGPSHGTVVGITLISLGITAALYAQFQSTLPLAIRAEHTGLAIYSTLILINSATVIIGEVPLSILTRRFAPWIPLALGIALMSTGIFLAGAFVAVPGVMVAGALIFTFGEMMFAPVANTVAARLAPAGKSARYQGYLSSMQALGFALGPAAGVALYFTAAAYIWLVILAIGLGLSVLLGALLRRPLGSATMTENPVARVSPTTEQGTP